MKTTDEIIASWETEGAYQDWYSIDSYNPSTTAIKRVFVGGHDDVIDMMKRYYIEPTEHALTRFYRTSLIPTEEARAYFDGDDTELDERSSYSITEVAGMLGVSRQRVHQLIQDGRLDATKVGKTWMVARYSVERRMEAGC